MTVAIENSDELIAIRHHLHAYPELGFNEHETTAFITHTLLQHGIDVTPSGMKTGLTAHVRGAAPGPRVLLRADIDGLPVSEQTGLDFASHNEGVMHACGHDLHMTGLLGAAFWLQEHREEIPGSINLLFQPAEELGQGALYTMDKGVLDNVDAAIGIHNNPDYAPGEVAVGTEPMMAGCVKFAVQLHAEGTHAGYPHWGTGPFGALASMMLSIQTIVSRNTSPFHPVVVSITEVHGGEVWNVVPAEAGFIGTARYFHQEDSQLVERRFHDIVQSTALAYGIQADIDWDDFQEPLVSDPELAEAVASDVPSYATLEPIKPSMAGEDFATFARQTRIVFGFIGSNGQPGHHNLHSPQFVGLDEAIPTAASFYVNAGLRVLRELA